ncbi:hypothetical protein [Aeromonas diversa]|uniref:hypothetical protein n=1 Tax=Aeromonas diversa TaxID=502790 RepID=UPI0005BE809D|nr:hypothetical protein [Aeromonas diversa]
MTTREECIALAHRFRLGHSVESCVALPPLLQRVMAELPASRHHNAATIMKQLLDCQERHDWLGLADWLEGELVTLLAP